MKLEFIGQRDNTGKQIIKGTKKNMEITSDNQSSGVFFVQSGFTGLTTGLTGLSCHNVSHILVSHASFAV